MAQNPELIQPLCSAPEKPVSIKALDFDFSSAARFELDPGFRTIG
jgi:hypothetical protein